MRPSWIHDDGGDVRMGGLWQRAARWLRSNRDGCDDSDRPGALAYERIRQSLRWPAVAVLLSAWFCGCGQPGPSLERGQPAPAFALTSLTEETVRLDEFAGRVVAVRFWADWCPFCKTEMQALEPVYRRLAGEGLVILAVNVRQDRETAAAFIAKLGTSYPVLLDRDGVVAKQYGVIGLPMTFILDRQGRLATRIVGESTPEVFERAVREAM